MARRATSYMTRRFLRVKIRSWYENKNTQYEHQRKQNPSTGVSRIPGPVHDRRVFLSYLLYINQVTTNQYANAHLINASGLQRMYSQRIALLVSQLRIAATEEVDPLRTSLRETVRNMRTDHEKLISGDPYFYHDYDIPPQIAGLYFDGSPSVHDQVDEYLLHALVITTLEAFPADDPHVAYILRQSDEIWRSLNVLVSAFQTEAEAANVGQRNLQFLAMGSLLLLIILSSWLIIIPILRHVNQEIVTVRKLEKLLKNVFNASKHGIFTMNPSGRLMLANEQGAQLSGYTTNELVDMPASSLLEKRDILAFEKMFAELAMARVSVSEMEASIQRKDGGKTRVQITMTPVLEKNEVSYVVATVLDVTKVKEQAQRVFELNELRNKFIRLMSHQLRTPMNAVRWNLEQLMDDKLGKLKPAQQGFVSAVHEATLEIIGRMDDLLVAMDIEEKRIVLRRQPGSFEAIVESVYETWKRQLLLRQLECKIEWPAKTIPVFAYDGSKIRFVLNQLFENAVTYSPKSGKVSFTVTKKGDSARFTITDNGIGIPKHEQPYIFRPFFRATNSYSMKSDSSGVGLYIAKYFVEMHGGKIGFTSEEGKGTSFWFELPLESRGEV